MEEFKIQINNIRDKELKNNIINHNNDKLNYINKSSYLNAFRAIISITTILDKSEKFDYLEDVSEVKLFKRYIDDAVGLINQSIHQREFSKNLKEAKDIRNELYCLLKIVEGYYIELSYLANMADYHILKLKEEDDTKDYNSINTERTIKLIHDKLELNKGDYTMYNYIISQIIQFIPMRLTKGKYIDIVKNAIKRNLKYSNKEEIEDKINYYKRQWDSSVQYGYGFKFDKYFALIQKLKNDDMKNKSLVELNNKVEEIISILKNINELYNFILIMGLTYNMIIAIYLISSNSLDEEILQINEQWNKILESRDKDDLNQFMELNEMKIKEIEINIIDNIEEFQELNNQAVKRKDFIDDELEEIFSYTKEILIYYNDYNLDNIDTILSKNNVEISHEYSDEWVNSLISYIRRSLNDMDNIEGKIRMKKLLSLIELPFSSISQFEDYIRYSLNNRISSSKEVSYIIDNIMEFMQNIGNDINI